jgi:hypothetical protein
VREFAQTIRGFRVTSVANNETDGLDMKLGKRLLILVFLAAYAALAACTSGSPAPHVRGASGAGTASAGTSSAGAIAAGGLGDVAGLNGGTAGQGSAGMSLSGTAGARAMFTGGRGAEAGGGGSVAGGTTSGAGAQANAGGTSGPAPAASSEDDGADCTVASLPNPASLPTISKLPDPFKKLDGSRMSGKAEWRCRREEIKRMAETYAFGTKPPPPREVTGSISNTSIMVKVMDSGKSTSFSAAIQLPTGGHAPYASIVVYGGGGFGAAVDSSVINSEGVALITYNPYDAGKEGTGRNSKQGAFYDLYGSTSTTGLLVAWGWGVSRIIDVIEKSDGTILKATAVGVTGCSRFGKGAFLAGVFDQRIALTMPIESGTAGVPIWRGVPGEGAQSLSSAYGEQPWFGDAFSAFTGSPTKAPIDTHELIAMVAPRGLFIMDNPSIANLGPKSAHAAALAGAEVYKALGVAANITYWSDVQNGSHCSMRPEWSAPLRSNLKKFLNNTGNDPGVIKAASKASSDLSQWKDWETPTLQ